jgi:hypothetical protein
VEAFGLILLSMAHPIHSSSAAAKSSESPSSRRSPFDAQERKIFNGMDARQLRIY